MKDANLCVAGEAVAETAGAVVMPNEDVEVDEAVPVFLKKGEMFESVDIDGVLGALEAADGANEKGVEALDAAPNPAKPVNLCVVLDCIILVSRMRRDGENISINAELFINE